MKCYYVSIQIAQPKNRPWRVAGNSYLFDLKHALYHDAGIGPELLGKAKSSIVRHFINTNGGPFRVAAFGLSLRHFASAPLKN